MGKSWIAILEISYLAMWDHTRCTHFLSIGIYQHAGILETAKNDMQDDLSLMYLSMYVSERMHIWNFWFPVCLSTETTLSASKIN